MKKFLTVLLALSVVFTYTVGSAFAVTADGKYTSGDYSKYLNDQWDNYYNPKLTVAEQDYAKALAASGENTLYNTAIKASDLGLKAAVAAKGSWTDKALEAYQAQIRADINTAKTEYISKTIEAVFGTEQYVTDSPETSTYDIGNVEVYGLKLSAITASMTGYTAAVNANIAEFKSAQAESLYTAVVATINAVSEDNYSTDNANAIAALKAEAIKAIEKTKNSAAADDAKAESYVKTFADFKTEADKIPTKDKEDLDDTDAAAAIASAVAKYVNYALEKTYAVFSLSAGDAVPADYASITGIDEKVYKKGTNKTATIFGIAIANTDKVTVAEATAVNKAFREAVVSSADVVTAYANALEGKTVKEKVEAVESLYAGNYECLRTINKAMNAAEVYADVVAEGEAKKAALSYGVKIYDDAKVDAAVKEAEALVYADLKAGFKTVDEYFTAAAKKLGYTDLYATNFEYKAFKNAIAEAKTKFFKADGTPQVKVLYGEDKTAEADYVYLKSTYATVEAAVWTAIANNTCASLDIAENYAEIDEIMADAATQMSELMLAKDEVAVTAAIASHKNALNDSLAEAKKIMGTKDYSDKAYKDAFDDGIALIEAADTIEEVKEAYTQAEALIRNIPTKADLAAAEKALIEKIAALPSTSDLTVADKDAVVAVLNEYVAYAAMHGADTTKITNTYTLNADLDAVLRLVHKDLNTKVEDMIKAINKNNPVTDNGAVALVEMKEDIIALIAEVKEFNGLLTKVDSVDSLGEFIATSVLWIDPTALKNTLNAENAIWQAEVHNLLAQANTANTIAEKKAVVEAYDKLTDRQKYKIEQNLKTLIEEVKADLIASVTSLKITASSVAKKGSITVNWKVKGDYAAADGYRVYKSTKKNSGFGTKPYFQTKDNTKMSYKNTKQLKKGTRYYYKVRAYVVVDGKTYFSDYSNKAYRIAK